MDCPVCKEPMIVLELDGVEIDHCLECHGIWLDEGELELILESADKKDELLASFQEAPAQTERPRKCPICLKKMLKIWVGESEKVLIDKCRKNDGLWFDAGELQQIMVLGADGKESKVLNLIKDMFGETA